MDKNLEASKSMPTSEKVEVTPAEVHKSEEKIQPKTIVAKMKNSESKKPKPATTNSTSPSDKKIVVVKAQNSTSHKVLAPKTVVSKPALVKKPTKPLDFNSKAQMMEEKSQREKHERLVNFAKQEKVKKEVS